MAKRKQRWVILPFFFFLLTFSFLFGSATGTEIDVIRLVYAQLGYLTTSTITGRQPQIASNTPPIICYNYYPNFYDRPPDVYQSIIS